MRQRNVRDREIGFVTMVFFFFFFFLIFGFVFLLFLFKIHLDPNSYDF